MWKLASVSVRNNEQVEYYLRQGYEPFAVTSEYGGERLWLKCKEVKETRKKNEVHSSKSRKSDRRTVSTDAPSPKEKAGS